MFRQHISRQVVVHTFTNIFGSPHRAKTFLHRRTFHILVYTLCPLFRWGGKRLYHFKANLFRKRCTKFHQNRPSFV